MRPTIVGVCLVGASAWLAGQQRPVFRSDVNVITVDAYPLKDGRVVSDLTKADFTVLEDGQPQAINTFEFVRADERMTSAERRDPRSQDEMLQQLRDPRARAFVALLDVHHVGYDGAFYGRQPLIELFQRILAPSDLIALTTSRNHPREMTFGRTTEVVEQQLTRWWTWLEPAIRIEDLEESALKLCYPFDEALVVELIARRRQDELLSSLEGTIQYLGEVREGRKNLFLFSRGWQWFKADRGLLKVLERPGYVPSKGAPVEPAPRSRPPATNEPLGNLGIRNELYTGERSACETELMRLAALDSAPRFRELIRAATVNNVAVYPVDVGGLVTGSGPRGVGPPGDRLLELAANTGGTAVSNRNDLVQGVIEVSREFSAYYLLSYTSTNQKTDGTYRRIEVRVNQPGIDMRARRGYRALGEREAASRSSAAVSVDIDASAEEVTAALDVLGRLRANEPLQVRAVREGTNVRIDVELGAGVSFVARTVDVVITLGSQTATARGRMPEGNRVASVLVAGAPTAAGAQVAVRARAEESDPLEGATVLGEVGGDVRLYRTRSGQTTPAADVRFVRADRLRAEWRLDAIPTSVSARVLDRTGQPLPVLVAATAAPVSANVLMVSDVTLSSLGTADYVLELTAGINGTAQRRLVAFRVGR